MGNGTIHRFRGFVATVIGVAAGTVTGAVASAFAGFFVGLVIVSVVTDDTGLASEEGINVIAGALASVGIGAATAFFVRQCLDHPRAKGDPDFVAGRNTAWLAGALNASAVLVTSLVTAFAMPNALGNVIGRFWVWPLWFIGVAFLARCLAHALDALRHR